MSRSITLIMLVFGASFCAQAQFAPQATIPGSTAIHKSSSLFTAWATDCSVQRGLMQIDNPSLGYASSGDSTSALGLPDGLLLSLGDSGVATLRFASPVIDGPGPDFAVFENGFPDGADPEGAFLELAFVEVSSDGVNYTRFPATSNVQDTLQHSSVVGSMFMNARQLNNLAGKYIAGWGTPFDLSELAGTPGLDIHHITHIRIVDVIGSISADGSRDNNGRRINDPFPTPFPAGGFDLDAVGLIHAAPANVLHANIFDGLKLYPNPAADDLGIILPPANAPYRLLVYDIAGREVLRQTAQPGSLRLSLRSLTPGAYYLTIRSQDGATCTRAFLHR
jgi:hypothetical protein